VRRLVFPQCSLRFGCVAVAQAKSTLAQAALLFRNDEVHDFPGSDQEGKTVDPHAYERGPSPPPQAFARIARMPNVSPKTAAAAPPTTPKGKATEPRPQRPTRTERTDPNPTAARSLVLTEAKFPEELSATRRPSRRARPLGDGLSAPGLNRLLTRRTRRASA
jgi:hypothetical protein